MAKPKPAKFVWDERAATLAVAFFERLLRHTKGEWAGQPFTLPRWQRDDIIRPLFGWKRADGTRRYRTAYIEVPRKNGKSTIAAGVALLLLLLDNEAAGEVYGAAADRSQASIVFDTASPMVKASPSLAGRCQIFKRSIFVPESISKYEVLSSDVPTKHGLNAHGIIFDELHAQPTRDLWDVLTTSTGSRRQPMTFAMTTAGYDRESICWEMHEYARQVLNRTIEDDSFFAYITAADESDDWTDERVWAKANPNLDVSIKRDYLREQCKRAELTPAYQNTFRRLHLNQWTQQDERWLSLSAWDACKRPIDWGALEGRPCWGGLDLASTSDIASLVLCFSLDDAGETFAWLPFFWIPADNMIDRARRDRVPYDAWVRAGLIEATPGNVIDYGFIVERILTLRPIYEIEEIAFDRWGAFQISAQLNDAGITMVQFGQGFVSMSAPMKELLRMTLNQQLQHDGNPVLRWMADNMVVTQDAAGNVKPNKSKSREKIDGMVAGVMALDRAVRHRPSVYDTRGVMMI
jgi:phage terminase large subunit-like protein